jgi:hypothetical protein
MPAHLSGDADVHLASVEAFQTARLAKRRGYGFRTTLIAPSSLR